MQALLLALVFALPVAQDELNGGPLDAIAQRIEARLDKIDTPIGKLGDNVEALRQDVIAARQERSTILARIKEMNGEREGLIARLTEARDEMRQAREEWRPLQNLVDRLISFVWKLFYLLALVAVLCLAVLGAISYVWLKIKSLVIPKL